MNTHDDSFMTLCNLWCEQQLTAEQLQELQTLLRSDRGLQRLFVEFTQLHGLLAWDAGVIAGSGLNGIGRDGALQPSIDSQIVPETRQRGSSSTVRDSLVVPALAGKCDECSWFGRLNFRLKAGLRTKWDSRTRYRPGLVATAAACLLLAGIAAMNWHRASVWQLADGMAQPGNGEEPVSHQLPPDSAQLVDSQHNDARNTNANPLKPLSLNGVQAQAVSPDVAATHPDTGSTTESVSATTVGLDDASIIAEIDRQIAAAWSDNKVVAAEIADDHEWVRRCFLTLTGRIPTVSEASAFVASTSPRKRISLVDSLLNDPRFAENLSVTWTNLLIGRTNARQVDQEALYGFLQRQFLKNRPWMETVGDLIAAEGRSDQNGATNFLLAHLNDQATPATAVTARLFLGQQVQCTQCHDHPFAKDRQQDEFWSLNAFFKQAERRPLSVTATDGKSQNVWTLADTGAAGMTFYDTLRGQQQAVLPEFDGHAMQADDSRSRRAELVRLLAADSHHRVAQAMINRTWAQVFGYGFTNPIDDLGPHNPVSHPELLDFLTQSFAESDYDVRRLMRWLTLSQTFQLSSLQTEQSFAIDDPQEGGTPLFSRAYQRPMGPEQVYDSIRIAIRSAADQPIDSSIGSTHRREWVEQFVQSYGTDENDEQLTFEGNITQAMLMMNGEDLQAAIPLTAVEVTKTVHEGPQGILKSLERIAMATLNREPSEREEKIFRGRYRALTRSMPNDLAIRTATEDMLWAYLNSSEFTSVH